MSISNHLSVAPPPSVKSLAAADAVPSPGFANGLDVLTPGDFELVYQATGVRITRDSQTAPTFAGIIASQRRMGNLPAGQPISADWLRELATSHRNVAGPTADQADLALQYLLKGRVDGRALSL